MRAVIGAGGTAGHVFPALATAAYLRDRLGAEVVFVGRAEGQEGRLVPAAGFRLEPVESLPFTRKVSLGALRAPFAALRAARTAREVVHGAGVVLGMGGYVSVPVALAARRERVPLVVHEQNASLGLANRLAARWARAVALSFERVPSGLPRRVRRVVTGNPVRGDVLRAREERTSLAADGYPTLRLDPHRRTVLVFGGSQGALRLNRATIEAAALLGRRSDLQLLLVTGTRHHDAVASSLRAGGNLLVRTVPFLERMELAYACADLVVSRAGATTVAELTACGLPAILVPYPHATGRHQDANAAALEGAGAAVSVPDRAATGPAIAARIAALVDDEPRLRRMASASTELGRPHAAEALADVVASVARRPAP